MSRRIVHPRNVDIAFSCVMRLSRISAPAIPDVVKFFVAYHDLNFRYDKKPIKRYVHQVLRSALELGHSAEATWLLWASLRLKIKLPSAIVRLLSQSDSSPVLLLGKAMEDAKMLPSSFSQRVFARRLVSKDFLSQNWLLAYEGAMRGWFGWSKPDIAGSIFESFANKDIISLT